MELIKAVLKNEALVAEMDASLADEQCFYLWWLGQSGFLLQWNRQRVLIDPYLSDSLTRKYADTDKPHTRMSELVIRPELLKHIDAVTSSHNHTDHLDAETLIPLINNNPGIKLVIPEANRDFVAERLNTDRQFPLGLNDGQTLKIGGISFHGIPARHNELERDEKGNCRYMGYVLEFGKFSIYHSGDTLRFEGMEALLQPFLVDVAILPINGNLPERRVAGNLNCREAAELGKAIHAKWVIPCHYDMFTFNTAAVSDFKNECEALQQPFRILQGGSCFKWC